MIFWELLFCFIMPKRWDASRSWTADLVSRFARRQKMVAAAPLAWEVLFFTLFVWFFI